jgi:hypothetical protein
MSLIQKRLRTKEVALVPKPVEGIVVKEAGTTAKERVFAAALMVGLTIFIPGLCLIIAPESLLNAESLIPQTTLLLSAISGGGGVILSRAFLWDVTRDNVTSGMIENSNSHVISNMGKFMEKSKKNRVLVHSFHIREEKDIDVDSWQDVSKATIVENATHSVNQYMVKVKGKYRLEQEVAPNAETIWDLSADALVEVYGIREKTDTQKEVTV